MAKITIDGRELETPDYNDLDMGQARIIKRYSGMSLRELGEADPSDPDVIAAFCHLALASADPDRSYADIEAEVSKIKFAKLVIENRDEQEDDADVPPPSSPNETDSAANGSGLSSPDGSAETPETPRHVIGVQTSATSSP